MRGSVIWRTLILFFWITNAGASESLSALYALEKTTVTYRKVQGHEIQANIYRPRGDATRPVIVYIHGGGLITGYSELDFASLRDYAAKHPEWPYFDLLQFASDKAYAIVSIDYRLAPESKLPDIISDLETAFSWIGGEGAKRFHLDTSRLVVTGESAGGYLALVTGYRVSPKPKALVSLYGFGRLNANPRNTSDPSTAANLKGVTKEEALNQTDGSVISDSRQRKGDANIILTYLRQNSLWLQETTGFSRETMAEQVVPYEPAQHVTCGYPPTLLIHGTHDVEVPFEESSYMATQFQSRGVPYILFPVAKGEHGLVHGDPKQLKAAYVSMQEFMIRYLDSK